MISKEEREQAQWMWENWYSLVDIGLKFGVSKEAVRQWKLGDAKKGNVWRRKRGVECARDFWENSDYNISLISEKSKTPVEEIESAARKSEGEGDPWMRQGEKFPWWGHRKWDHPDKQPVIRKILKLRRQGLSVVEIAREVNISISIVTHIENGILFRSGLPYNGHAGDEVPEKKRKFFDDEDRELARLEYEDGTPIQDIARQIGCSDALIYQWKTIGQWTQPQIFKERSKTPKNSVMKRLERAETEALRDQVMRLERKIQKLETEGSPK